VQSLYAEPVTIWPPLKALSLAKNRDRSVGDRRIGAYGVYVEWY